MAKKWAGNAEDAAALRGSRGSFVVLWSSLSSSRSLAINAGMAGSAAAAMVGGQEGGHRAMCWRA